MGGPIPLERATTALDRTGGWVLERFQLRRELPADPDGPDGVTWQARERESRQAVVVRLYDAGGVERAKREAAALRAILERAGAGVLRYVADGPDGDGWAVVTEPVEGATLAKVLRVTSPSPPRAIGWARQVCAALETCHAAGVVHGDLHPGKIVVTRDAVGRDRLVLVGFDRAVLGDVPAHGLLATTAPERLGPGPVDARADQYAVGAILYRLLVERWPLSDEEVRAGTGDPPPLGHHAPALRLPPGLEAIVLRCLSRRPEARYASIAELEARLAEVEYLPQRDWVRVTGLDLTIAPNDREPEAPFVPGVGARVALALVACGSLVAALWLASQVP